jgi:hypothetical protein
VIAYLLIFALLVAALAWFFFGGWGDAPEPTARRRVTCDVDYAELEQAEREARDADGPDDVRDWGPGTPRPPL